MVDYDAFSYVCEYVSPLRTSSNTTSFEQINQSCWKTGGMATAARGREVNNKDR